MLDALGLDPVAESVYRSLLEHPGRGVCELAAHLQLTEPQVRAALDQLAVLSLLRDAGTGSGAVRAVSPQVGLTALLARSEAELARSQRRIEATRASVAALASTYGAVAGDEASVDQLDGVERVRVRLADMAAAATSECLSFLPGGSQKPDTMAASEPLDQQALERGVAVRSIYQESFRNDPGTLAYVRWLAALGGETRTVPSLPMLMVIVDRRVAMVPLDPDDGRRGALVLTGAGVLAALCAVFDQFWRAATPWEQDLRRDESGLSAQERELLWLLGQGLTDEVAARRLGVSLRTVRRTASDLMGRLKARSRFEAGVRAAHRGWL